MFDTAALKAAEKEVKTCDSSRTIRFKALMQRAELKFQRFRKRGQASDLKGATALWLEALPLQRTNLQVYTRLAFSMFVFQQREWCLQYLNHAQKLSPKDPEVQTLQEAIHSNAF